MQGARFGRDSRSRRTCLESAGARSRPACLQPQQGPRTAQSVAARKRWRGSAASVEVVEEQEAAVLDRRHVPLGNSARERRARRTVQEQI